MTHNILMARRVGDLGPGALNRAVGQFGELNKAGQTGIRPPARPRVPYRHMEGPPQVMLPRQHAMSRAKNLVSCLTTRAGV